MNCRYLDKDIYRAVNEMSKYNSKRETHLSLYMNGLRWCYATTITYILSTKNVCHNA